MSSNMALLIVAATFIVAGVDATTSPCAPNSITDNNMAASIAKVTNELVFHTYAKPGYKYRLPMKTNGVTAYGYAYCSTYYTQNDCYKCLLGLVDELSHKCLNAPEAEAYNSYCYLKYGPNPV
ncbi:hypothetical protein LINPERPRIM_LOCUS39962 [Linum perenne]